MAYLIRITDLTTNTTVIDFDRVDSHELNGDVLTMTGRFMNDTTVKLAAGWMVRVGDR